MANVRACTSVLLVTIIVFVVSPTAAAQETVPLLINYQGELAHPATGELMSDGAYDMVFYIYDAEFGGSALWTARYTSANGNPVRVIGGIFSVILGSGTGNVLDSLVFNGPDRWLEIQVGTETLSPRQRMTSVAYSLIAENSRLLSGREASQFANSTHAHSGSEITSGTVSEARIDPAITRDTEKDSAIAAHRAIPDAHHTRYANAEAVAAMGAKADSNPLNHDKTTSLAWTSITSIPAGFADGVDNDSGGASWSLTGNTGTSGTNFLGTADAQALELRVNSVRAFRIEPGTSPNLIAGHSENSASTGVVGATIGGGGSAGLANRVFADYGTVGGGGKNDAASEYATVGGGYGNTASNHYAAVAGGQENVASGWYAAVGGGYDNSAEAWCSTAGGGWFNQASASYATIAGGGPSDQGNPSGTSNLVTDEYGTIGGGGNNQAGNSDGDSANATYATVGGGEENRAGGTSSTVGGGERNEASELWSTVGGGYGNEAIKYGTTIAGGDLNEASGDLATVGGGYGNKATGGVATVSGGNINEASGHYATVPGGFTNKAKGDYSFAAGRHAIADGEGSFVWGDSNAYDLHAWGANEFVVRATGGFWFITKVDGAGYPIEGMMLPAGTSHWVPIGSTAAQLSDEQPHLVRELESENTSLRERIDDLEFRLAALEALIQAQKGGQQ